MLRPKIVTLAALALAALAAGPSWALSSPTQPKTGPGASLDTTGEVVKRAIGKPGEVTYVFHMASAPEKPRSVVVLLHAWGAANPVVYGAWIDHLARRGHLVLFPGFQVVGSTKPTDATDRAGALIKSALAQLASDPQAKPDPAETFYLAHSAGTGIAVNLAARAKDLDIPAPKLIFALMAGGIAKDDTSRGIRLADLAAIPEATNLVLMSGDQTNLAADRLSRRILKETSSVPAVRKLFMRSASDDHGFPPLTATLASPAGPMDGYSSETIKLPTVEEAPKFDAKGRRLRPPPPPRVPWSVEAQLTGEQRVLLQQVERNTVDTLDWLAYWRVFDMLIATTETGADLVGLRQDPSFLDMGRWTDGWPVRRLSAETPKTETSAPASGPAPVRTGPPPIQSKQPVTRRRFDSRHRH
ncbi:alpha/beta hydrolase [Enterovirga sp.]|uniref:alpha/beta hydrolase n=1 Tax=Enterovirga sp. TaxID=2026350 RepID=UPI002CE5490C|nr:alpha/beta hydrolase [Enterovirga sp.]HMO28472.1 alpha/beta hydrolase [Enterovirga sp.]